LPRDERVLRVPLAGRAWNSAAAAAAGLEKGRRARRAWGAALTARWVRSFSRYGLGISVMAKPVRGHVLGKRAPGSACTIFGVCGSDAGTLWAGGTMHGPKKEYGSLTEKDAAMRSGWGDRKNRNPRLMHHFDMLWSLWVGPYVNVRTYFIKF